MSSVCECVCPFICCCLLFSTLHCGNAQHYDIKDYARAHLSEEVPGVALQWLFFGHNNHMYVLQCVGVGALAHSCACWCVFVCVRECVCVCA